MDATKRSLQQISPDYFLENTPKKHSTVNKMDSQTSAVVGNNILPGGSTIVSSDSFSWAVFDQKLNNALDVKLESVVKKEDIAHFSQEIEQLRCENKQLRNDLLIMKNKLEQVDKSSRRNNIVVRGLTGNTVASAVKEFKVLCDTTLKAAANVMEARKIANGKSFLLTLNSALEVRSVLSSRGSLAGSNIFIDKDYTEHARSIRYFLRQIGRRAKNVNKRLTIRYGDLNIIIDGKSFYCADNTIFAGNKADADFLRDLMANANFQCNIEVKNAYHNKNAPSTVSNDLTTSG